MRSEQITYLKAIAHYKSLNAAANTLHITPQALGKSLHNLEKELGYALLTTSKAKSLTPAGEELLEICLEFQKNVACLSEKYTPVQLGNDFPQKSLLSFASSELFLNTGLNDIINFYCKQYPEITLNLITASRPYIIQSILDRTAEFGIFSQLIIEGESFLYSNQDQNALLEFIPIALMPNFCICNVSHPLAQKNVIANIRDVFQYPNGYLGDDESIYHKYDFSCRLLGVENKGIMERNYHVFMQRIRNQQYVAITSFMYKGVHKFQTPDYPDIKYIPIEDDSFQNILIYIKRKNKRLSQNAATFIQALEKMVLKSFA